MDERGTKEERDMDGGGTEWAPTKNLRSAGFVSVRGSSLTLSHSLHCCFPSTALLPFGYSTLLYSFATPFPTPSSSSSSSPLALPSCCCTWFAWSTFRIVSSPLWNHMPQISSSVTPRYHLKSQRQKQEEEGCRFKLSLLVLGGTMGIYLSTPKTEKISEDGENAELRFGLSAMQGWRESMEDAHTAILDVDEKTSTSIFGVFDGHGGKVVSKFCAKYLHREVIKCDAYAKGDLGGSLEHSFLRMDEMMKGARGYRELMLLEEKSGKAGNSHGSANDESDRFNSAIQTEGNDGNWTEVGPNSDYKGPSSGSTAVVALIRGRNLIVANAGDSRCIISRRGQAENLSVDHKPELELEKERINKAGGFIHAGRVNGSLNLTRAIGDMEFKYQTDLPPDKQIVTCCPDIRQVDIGPGDEFIVLACDGIWDVMSSQAVVDFVIQKLPTAKTLSSICEDILDHCLSPSTRQQEGCDNMSIIIVQLKQSGGIASGSADPSL